MKPKTLTRTANVKGYMSKFVQKSLKNLEVKHKKMQGRKKGVNA